MVRELEKEGGKKYTDMEGRLQCPEQEEEVIPSHIPEGSPHEDRVGSYSFTSRKHLTYLKTTSSKVYYS